MPKVSVVIVTYNKADTLPAAIQSVVNQTYQDLEILVVDDGSTDNTAEVAATFKDQIRYLPKQNGGTGSARNLGIEQAKGDYVAFLDGDDLWLPNKLEIQMEAFEREPEIVAVQCSVYCVDPELRLLEKRQGGPRQDTLLDFLLFHNLPGFSSAVVIRRHVLRKIGGFGLDLVILSDWDMACRLALAGTLRTVPDFLVLYRQYPSNQSKDVEIHIDSGVRFLSKFFSRKDLRPAIQRQQTYVWARFYAMLSGGYIRNHQWGLAVRWSLKALSRSPKVLPYILGMPFRRLKKVLVPTPRLSFADQFSQTAK